MTFVPPRTGATAAVPPQAPRRRPAPHATVCRDPREFAALAAEWQRLQRRCPSATPFQTHAWLHSWWLSYGVRGRLRIVLVRRGGELVAAAPLMRAWRPLPVLVPVGGAITDFTDVLIDTTSGESATDEITAALVAGLRRAARGAVIDLREVRPDAAADRVYARWRGPKRHLADSVCLELPCLPLDGLIARTGSSRGQRIRNQLRKIDAAGIEEREVPAAEVPAAVANLLRLHLLQWEGRGVTPEHVRPRFAEHLTRAVGLMAASGDAVITEFAIGGEVVVANLMVLSPGLAGGYLYGVHPVVRNSKVDVSTLLIRHGVRHAEADGRERLSLLRGAEPYKFHWRPEHLANRRMLLANRTCAVGLLVRYGLARGRGAAGRSARLRVWRDRAQAWWRGRPVS